MAIGTTSAVSAEFYLAWKSSTPYCFLYGSSWVACPACVPPVTDCSTKVMVTRSDQYHWTISTVDGTDDIAMMTYNNPATKMPFGMTVTCPTCPWPTWPTCP